MVQCSVMGCTRHGGFMEGGKWYCSRHHVAVQLQKRDDELARCEAVRVRPVPQHRPIMPKMPQMLPAMSVRRRLRF